MPTHLLCTCSLKSAFCMAHLGLVDDIISQSCRPNVARAAAARPSASDHPPPPPGRGCICAAGSRGTCGYCKYHSHRKKWARRLLIDPSQPSLGSWITAKAFMFRWGCVIWESIGRGCGIFFSYPGTPLCFFCVVLFGFCFILCCVVLCCACFALFCVCFVCVCFCVVF